MPASARSSGSPLRSTFQGPSSEEFRPTPRVDAGSGAGRPIGIEVKRREQPHPPVVVREVNDASVGEPEELLPFRTILQLPMIIGWDAYLVQKDFDYFVRVSHDSYVHVVSNTPDRHRIMLETVRGWNPKELT